MTRVAPDPLLLFSTQSYRYLTDAIHDLRPARFSAGEVERRTFPDGERYQRIVDTVAGRDVAIIGGTITDADTLELFDLACGVAKYGAARLTLVLPYFSYSTMERATKTQEVVTAKARAQLLSAVPAAARGNRVVLLDLHSEGITHYFEGAVSPVHLYAKPAIQKAARELGGDDFVLACTDAGRAKWVASLANDFGVPAAFVYKRRLDAERTEVSAVSAYVEGKPVIIYDDMIRTGGSLINAAQAYHDAGAASVSAITTHGLFCGDSLARLEQCGLLSAVVCTDSHPRFRELPAGFLRVESVAELFADFLSNG